MKGYIVYSTYRIIEDLPTIYLFGRLHNGESFLAKIPFRPYFYIKKSDLEEAKKQLELEFEKASIKDFDEAPLVVVYAKSPRDVPTIRKTYEDAGIKTYEADIRFVQRYFIDYDILGTIEIEGESFATEFIDRVYESAEIKTIKPYEVDLKILSVDIETDMDAKCVYAISIYTGEISETHLLSKGANNAYCYDSEKELLNAFAARIKEIDPDVITGWNVIDFDLKVLRERFRANNLPFVLGRTSEECKVRVQADFFRESSADFNGRIIFDGISLLRQAFISFEDYKLDTVAEEVLGRKKIELEDDFWENFTDIIKEEPERVADYNLEDAKLAYEIVKEKKLIKFMVQKSLITGMQLDRVKASIAALDSLYIRKAKEAGYACPNSGYGAREERVKGAFVMDPKPGIYEYVAVMDFKSLYPSVMRTFNIDPIAFSKGGEIIAPNGASFANIDAILPQLIEILWKERDKAKKEGDSVKNNAIKVIMNSFYGVLANPTCRFYSLDMANAITGFARMIIKETSELIEKEGYEVIYGDTDSVFVDLKGDKKTISETGKKIASDINTHFNDKIKNEYKRNSLLELEFEKMFKVLIIPRLRGSEGGAKKRYAGLVVKNNKEYISVTGMEFVRRDWTELSKKVQMELLDRIFHKKEVATYLKDIIKQVREGKLDSLLLYKKAIRKDLMEYTKTTPPHVKAARQLPKLKSNIISYYITKNGPEPAEMLKSPIDYEHYIEKQIRPIAESILNLFDMDFDEVTKNSNQTTLSNF